MGINFLIGSFFFPCGVVIFERDKEETYTADQGGAEKNYNIKRNGEPYHQ